MIQSSSSIKKMIIGACVLLISAVSWASGPAGESAALLANESGTSEYERSALRRDLAFLAAPIKSSDDLRAHLEVTLNSPMNALSPKGRAIFISSLRFSDRGLSSFDYQVLEQELSATEAFKILALFGHQHSVGKTVMPAVRNELDAEVLKFGGYEELGTDQKDHECTISQPRECVRSTGRICTSNC